MTTHPDTPDLLTQSAPERVWLQVDTSGDPHYRDEPFPEDGDAEVTWCRDSIGGQEVEYVRADLAAPTAPVAPESQAKPVADYWIEPETLNCIDAKTKRDMPFDASTYTLPLYTTPIAAPEAVAPVAPVAWAQTRTIDDDDGRPIGSDEPRVVWGAENPDPCESWHPLYADPSPVVVYQATSRTRQSAYFGEWSAARAWAGEHGSVTMHAIPPARPELRSVDEFAVIDEGAWNRLKPTHPAPPPASAGLPALPEAGSDCCGVAVAIASKYVLENMRQVEAIGQRLSAGPFANGWSTACDEIIERLCDPSAPTAISAHGAGDVSELVEAGKALSFAAQITGGTAGRDEGLVAAIDRFSATLKNYGEGRWFDPMSPNFNPGRVLAGLHPSEVGDLVPVRRSLLRDLDEALQRHIDGHAPRQIPVHRADSDILQAELRVLIGWKSP